MEKISGVDGYWIRVATNKSFTKGLKKVYVKVRAFKKNIKNPTTAKTEIFYANWSTVKHTAKIK